MDFDQTDDRRMIADLLSRWLGDNYAIEDRNRIAASPEGWSRQAWRSLASLGIVGALLPERGGGYGGDGFDIAAVFEAAGRRLVVEPFLGTLMAARVLVGDGSHRDVLDAVVGGDTVLAFAHEEEGSRYDVDRVDTRATRSGDGWRLDGAKIAVPQLLSADAIVVTARGDDGLGAYLIRSDAAGVTIRDHPLIDGGHGGDLILADVTATRVGGAASVADAYAAGIVALCWEAVGIMAELLSATVDYLRTRRQFGKPLGSFQAVRHRLATLALETEQVRSAAINAAAALDADPHARDRSASAAKFTIDRVGRLMAEEAIQLHGGIGMTWELPVSHYAKRLTMIGHQLGDEDHHLERFARLGRAAPIDIEKAN